MLWYIGRLIDVGGTLVLTEYRLAAVCHCLKIFGGHMKRWYVIYVRTGREEAARLWLIKYGDFLVSEVLVPRTIKYEWKKGTKNLVSTVLFKGYVLVHMDLSAQGYHVYYSMKENPYAYRLLGDGNSIYPVEKKEIDMLLKFMDAEGIIQLTKACYDGNRIKFISGPLCGKEDMVIKVNRRKERAYIRVNIAGKIVAIAVGLEIIVPPVSAVERYGNYQ